MGLSINNYLFVLAFATSQNWGFRVKGTGQLYCHKWHQSVQLLYFIISVTSEIYKTWGLVLFNITGVLLRNPGFTSVLGDSLRFIIIRDYILG